MIRWQCLLSQQGTVSTGIIGRLNDPAVLLLLRELYTWARVLSPFFAFAYLPAALVWCFSVQPTTASGASWKTGRGKKIAVQTPVSKVWKVLVKKQYIKQWIYEFSKGTVVTEDWHLNGIIAMTDDDGNRDIPHLN